MTSYLDDRLAPVFERATVDLGDGGTGERSPFDRRKQLRQWEAELLPNGLVHLVVRGRWRRVLELRSARSSPNQKYTIP